MDSGKLHVEMERMSTEGREEPARCRCVLAATETHSAPTPRQ